jgi:hypothetical protein
MNAEKDWQKLLADVATGVWKLRQRMLQAGRGDLPEGLRRAGRDVEALWTRLHEGGVEILDHTGEAYDPSRSLHVITFQPTGQIQKDQIIETIKPTVYYQQERIQVGEVIVGIPVV